MAAVYQILLVAALLLAGQAALGQTMDAPTKFRLAQGLEQASEYERSSALYRELLAGDPGAMAYFDGLQRTLLQMKKYDEAALLLEKKLAQSPADIALRASLGTVFYKAGKEREAFNEWEKILSGEPVNPVRFRLVAQTLLDNRLLDRAAEAYRRGREASKDERLFTLELAQVLAVSMDYRGATAEYIRWLLANPAQLSFVQGRMAQFTGREEARSDAIAAVQGEISKNDAVQLQELFGWLLLEGKRYDEAFGVFANIDRLTRAQGNVLFSFAERAFKERSWDIAAKSYSEAIAAPLPPAKIPYARFGYARAVNALGVRADSAPSSAAPVSETVAAYGKAVELFSGIVRDYRHSDVAARALIEIGMIQWERFFDCDAALRSFAAAGAESSLPMSVQNDIMLRVGQVQGTKGDAAASAAAFEGVLRAPGITPDQEDEAMFRMAELDYFAGRFDAAIARLDSITVNLKADYANDALELRSFLQENAKTAAPALAEFGRADFLSRQRKRVEAAQILQNIVKQFPQSLLVDDALMKIAQLQSSAGLYADAAASYLRLLTEFKESSIALDRARFELGDLYQTRLREPAKAIASYQQLLEEHPRSLLADEARRRIRMLRGETL